MYLRETKTFVIILVSCLILACQSQFYKNNFKSKLTDIQDLYQYQYENYKSYEDFRSELTDSVELYSKLLTKGFAGLNFGPWEIDSVIIFDEDRTRFVTNINRTNESGKKSDLRITKENNSLKRLRLMTREEVELDFSNLPSLEYYIENITYNTRKDYYSLQHIKYLQLGGNQEMDFSFLNSITNLKVLVLGVFKNIVDLSFLSELKNLEYLCILDAGNLVSLDGLEKLKNLRYFFMTIKKKFNLDSIKKLDECPSIKKFGFNYPSMKREKLFAELESKYPDRFSHRIYAAFVNSDDTISLSTTKIEY